ncbi:MAG: lipopolysaccharide biosynthesis protein [Mongoliitalea sp.]
MKNVITLMTGTSIAQAIPIALSPILTRIYSPQEFGLYALYVGLATILGVVATGRYELAIMLPEDDEDALQIVGLSSLISLIVSVVVLLIVLFFGELIALMLGNGELYSWLFFLPITIFLTGFYQSLNYWFNRKKDFKQLAKNRVLQNTSTGFTQVPLGYININGFGLLFGTIFGQFVTTFLLAKNFLKIVPDFFSYLSKHNFQKIAGRYINFPKYDVSTALLNSASMYAPNILFTTFFGATFSGFFYLTQRVLQAPITLISSSVLDVFKEEASKSFRELGNAKFIFMRTFKWLFFISIFPTAVIYIFIEDLFLFFFGSDWETAGLYAKILTPALAIRFIANPLSFMIYIAEKQIINLITMVILSISIFGVFLMGFTHFEVVKAISFIYIIYYTVHLLISARLAKVY